MLVSRTRSRTGADVVALRRQRLPARPARGRGRRAAAAPAGQRRARGAGRGRPRRGAAGLPGGARGDRSARPVRTARSVTWCAARSATTPTPGGCSARRCWPGATRRRAAAAAAGVRRGPGRRDPAGRPAACGGHGARGAGGAGPLRGVRRGHPADARCRTRRRPAPAARRPAGPGRAGPRGPAVRRSPDGRPRRRRGPDPGAPGDLAGGLRGRARRPRQDPDGAPGRPARRAAGRALRGAGRCQRARGRAARGGLGARGPRLGDQPAFGRAARPTSAPGSPSTSPARRRC